MRAFLEAIALVLIAGAIFIGAPIAGALTGSLMGIIATVLIVYVVIKMIREEANEPESTRPADRNSGGHS